MPTTHAKTKGVQEAVYSPGFRQIGLEYGFVKPYVAVPRRTAREPAVRVPLGYERLMAERPSPFAFLQQVRAEAAKIVWPSRRETGISTVMVLIMAVLAAIFFLIADQLISFGVQTLLGLGG
jgi:preprotein translocase subunit SecE